LCPPRSPTRNMALGRGSITFPSHFNFFFFGHKVQNLRPIVRHRHRMLEVRGAPPRLGHHRPAVPAGPSLSTWPAVIMGSRAKTSPLSKRRPFPPDRRWTPRALVHPPSDLRARRSPDDPEPGGLGPRLDGGSTRRPGAGPDAFRSIPSCKAAVRLQAGACPSPEISSTAKVDAVSPMNPSSVTPRSRLTRSPDLIVRRGEGIPWTTSSLMDTHTDAGYPR